MSYVKQIKKLQSSLQNESNPATKIWFENYLKGTIQYRGLKTPQILKIINSWRKREGIDKLSSSCQLQIAGLLIQQTYAEDKFAGTLMIQKFLLAEIELDILIEEFEKLFTEGHFYDWSTTDWFCIRVLAGLINIHNRKAITAITKWYKAKDLWQRRASMVPLRTCTTRKEYIPVIERQIKRLVKQEERFIQTAIGWVIADLSKHFPKQAAQIVETHLVHLSMEVIRRHSKHLPRHKEYILEKKAIGG